MEAFKKLMLVQSKLKAPKGQTNTFGKYKYRNCEDILEALKPLLLENNCTLFISDNLENIGDRYYIKATVTFIDVETGKTIQNTSFAREEESKRGMDGSQVTGASSSYARKYALNGLFGIDDTKDSDGTNDCTTEKQEGKNQQSISEKQINRLYAIAKEKGYDSTAVNTLVFKKTNKQISDICKNEYDGICKGYEDIKAVDSK